MSFPMGATPPGVLTVPGMWGGVYNDYDSSSEEEEEDGFMSVERRRRRAPRSLLSMLPCTAAPACAPFAGHSSVCRERAKEEALLKQRREENARNARHTQKANEVCSVRCALGSCDI